MSELEEATLRASAKAEYASGVRVERERERESLALRFCKRSTDLIFGIIGCLALLPLAIIVKLAYVLSGDFHSIFYTQDRIGRNGKIFKLYKFRSMVPNADKELKKLLRKKEYSDEWDKYKKLQNDPRITKVGKIIRRLSIDEMPQFINILTGKMSLVGNRPYLPREKEDMSYYYDDIVSTKPGLISLWAINGRNNLDFVSRLKLERYYSKNVNPILDIKILILSVFVVIKGKGAV